MVLQFAWLETLLIGVSGAHANGFSTRHVVDVVQSFCRLAEHDPATQRSIITTANENGLTCVEAIAALIML